MSGRLVRERFGRIGAWGMIATWGRMGFAVVVLIGMICARNANSAEVGGTESGNHPSLKMSDAAVTNLAAQLNTLYKLKKSMTPAQKKLPTEYFLSVPSQKQRETGKMLPKLIASHSQRAPTVYVDCNIKCVVSDRLERLIESLGGRILSKSERFGSIHAQIPNGVLERIAANEEVQSIRKVVRPKTNKMNTSEADQAHKALTARELYGVTGNGIKVGVISDSIRYLEEVQATGDLPSVDVLSGLDGLCYYTTLEDGSYGISYLSREPDANWVLDDDGNMIPADLGEGTAMLEIVHDLAPDAELMFATSLDTVEEFAEIILALADHGCNVIVDDISFYDAPFFGDNPAIEAINEITERGVVYLTSAGNQGNVASGASGTWEGDFSSTGKYDDDQEKGRSFEWHSFGDQEFNAVQSVEGDPNSDYLFVILQWSDRFGASDNDYDLYLVNYDTGDLIGASVEEQSGYGNPCEVISVPISILFGNSPGIVVVKEEGADARFLHVIARDATIEHSTSGSIVGHNGALNAVSLASAPTVTNKQFSASHPVDDFSGDGPRRVYYDPQGNLLGGGNLLSTGGILREKPDFIAADGVSCATPGFAPFPGTSASAPHAAAIVALMLEANPELTRDDIFEMMKKGTFSGPNATWDNTRGYGILNAEECVRLAAESNPNFIPPIPLAPTNVTYFANYPNQLAWNAVPGGNYYRVYRASNPFAEPEPYGDWQTQNSLTVERAPFGQLYFYFVKASYDKNDEATASPFSKEMPMWYSTNLTGKAKVYKYGSGEISEKLYSSASITLPAGSVIVQKNSNSSTDINVTIERVYTDVLGVEWRESKDLNSDSFLVWDPGANYTVTVKGSANTSRTPRFYGFEPSKQSMVKPNVWISLPHYIYQSGVFSLTIDTNNKPVPKEGGKYSVSVTATPCSTTWTVSVDKEWVHLYRTSSKGSGVLGYLVEENEGGAREATITFKSGGTQYATLAVKQAGGAVTPTVTSVSITGADEVAAGVGKQYTCSANWSNGKQTDETERAKWKVISGGTYGEIDDSGYFRAYSTSTGGDVTIRAEYGGKSDTKTIHVEAESSGPTVTSVSIMGPDEVTAGGGEQYTCWANWSDGDETEVTDSAKWKVVSGGTYGKIDSSGYFTAYSTSTGGDVVIRADYGDTYATKTIHVEAEISGPTVTSVSIMGPDEVTAGGGEQYTCMAYWSDGDETDVTDRASWDVVSGDTYGEIDDSGYFRAYSTSTGGDVTIRADYGDTYDTKTIHVMAAVVVPENDDFSNPQTLTGKTGRREGSNVGATMEYRESIPSAQSNSTGSVWFLWKAPASGTATFDTFGSDFDTVLGVWTGDKVSSLHEIKSNDDVDEDCRQSEVSFAAEAGTTYRIAVYGYDDHSDHFILNWNLVVIETVTISFESNGGDSFSPIEYTVGEEYGWFPDPSKKGYTFEGWYADSSCTRRVWESDEVTKDVKKLYAYWIPISYLVVYALDGGTAGANAPRSAPFGTSFAVSAPTKTGHTFAGWTVSGALDSTTAKWGKTSSPTTAIANSSTLCQNGTGNVYFLNLASEEDETVTLTANWKPISYAVSYVLGEKGKEGSHAPTNATFGTAFYVSAPTRTDYEFGGWTVTSGLDKNTAKWGTTSNPSTAISSSSTKCANGATGNVYFRDLRSTSGSVTLQAVWTVTNQTVTFDANGGTCGTASKKCRVGGTYGTLPVATKPGNGFLGWFTGASSGDEVKFTDKVTAAATRKLFAHWTTVQTVTFDPNGGSCSVESKGCTIGQPYKNLPVASKAGYAFVGWFTAKDGGTQIVEGETVATELAKRTLYAHWTTIQTVTFDANGGACSVATKGCTIGQPYRNLPVATKEGYAFAGWFTEKDKGEQVVEGETEVTEEAKRSLYAHWTTVQTVTFDPNGGSCSVESKGCTIGQPYRNLPVPTKKGYAFVGWFTAKDKGTQVIEGDTVVSEAATRTLYAHWTDKQVTTFKGNGGSPATQVTTNTIATKYGTFPEVSWANHVFQGWFTETEGGDRVTVNSTVTQSAKRTLYAHWTDQQVATFKWNDGTTNATTATYTMGQAYGTLPSAPKRAGYAFVGWFTGTSSGDEVKATDKATVAATRTLYAHWTTVQTVTFDANGGTCTVATKGCTIGQPYKNLPVATRAGYAFAGWFTAKDNGTQVVEGETVATEEAKRTLYAHWTTIQTVTFDANGGNCSVVTKGCTVGQPYRNLPVATKTGVAFVGWFTAKDKGTQIVEGETLVTEVATRTLYAHWTDKQTTTFNGNGGSPATQVTTNVIAAKYGNLPTAQRTGYAFVGWFTAADGGTQVTANTTVTVAATRTLYAHWTDKQVTTFKGNGGSPATQVTTNTIATKYGALPEVSWANHVFQGWFTETEGGDRVTVNSTVTQSAKRTLYAHWTDQQVATFLWNDGTTNATTATYTMGQAYGTLPTAPKRAGYAFVGWFTGASSGDEVKATDKATVAATRTLYAHWTTVQTVKFDANGGSCSVATKGCTIGQPYKNLPMATRAGYAFAGWFTAKDGGTQVVEGETVATEEAKRTLYAHWTTIQTVTFDANGGNCSVESKGCTVGQPYRNLPVATKTGVAFVGWFTAKDMGTQVVEGETLVTEVATRTLYAHWTDTQATTFNGNGGSPATQVTTNVIAAKYGNLPTAQRTGYAFVGWFTAADGGTQVTANTTVTVAATRTLYAHWTDQQVTTFKGNGGSPATQVTTNTIATKYGTLPEVSWANHVFQGWFDAADGGVRVTVNTTVTQAAKRTLYAHWTDQQVATFRWNDGTTNATTATYTMGQAYGTLPTAPKRAGYAFVGWFTGASSGDEVKATDKATVAATRTLYAHWTTVQTVTFDANGGTCTVATKGCTIGQPYKNLPVATRAGYAFAGWFTAKDNGTQVVEGETMATEEAKRTLYARWTTIQTVTFDANGGNCSMATKGCTVGQPYRNLPVATKAGGAFVGWFTAKDKGTQVVEGVTVVPEVATRTLYAHWTDQQATTFNGNGGSPATQVTTNVIAAKYGELPTAQRTGYAFVGWFTEADGGTRVTANTTVTVAATRTLYAHWTDQQVTTFKGNGGSPSSQVVTNTIGTKYGTFPEVSWTNHVFKGWFDAADGGVRVTVNTTVNQAAKRTLYAHWTDQQTATFRWNDGTTNATTATYTMAQAYGTLPTAPKRAGYAFVGWFTASSGGDEVKATDKATVATARTLYAHWTTVQTVTFDANGGTCTVATKGCTIGQPYKNLPVATRAGYAFAGWFTAKDNGTQVVEGETVATEEAKRTLYARWTTIQTVTFDANGGTCAVATKGCTIGQPYKNLPVATRTGYAFVGWFTAKDKGEQVVEGVTVATEVATRTLYAHWRTALNGLSITGMGFEKRLSAAGEAVVVLRLKAAAGKTYQVQWTSVLGKKWETIKSWTATADGEVEVEAPLRAGDAGTGFYRIASPE